MSSVVGYTGEDRKQRMEVEAEVDTTRTDVDRLCVCRKQRAVASPVRTGGGDRAGPDSYCSRTNASLLQEWQ